MPVWFVAEQWLKRTKGRAKLVTDLKRVSALRTGSTSGAPFMWGAQTRQTLESWLSEAPQITGGTPCRSSCTDLAQSNCLRVVQQLASRSAETTDSNMEYPSLSKPMAA